MRLMNSIGSYEQVASTLDEACGVATTTFLALHFALGLGLGSNWR